MRSELIVLLQLAISISHQTATPIPYLPLFSSSRVAVSGDYRSVSSGPWNVPATWEAWNGTEWVIPTTSPDSSSGTITIRKDHVVTVTSTVMYDQVVVEPGGTVVIGAGVTHTLTDGPGIDLQVNGIWHNQGASWTMSSGAKWAVGDGGTYIHETTSGVSTPLSKAVLAGSSTFVYRGSSSRVPSSSFSGRTYGNLLLESGGGTWTCNATGSSPLTINGSLTIGPGVRWTTGGFSGAIQIAGTTTLAGEWSGSGTGKMGLHTFGGSLIISVGGIYQLSTTGAVQGDVILLGDCINNGILSLPSNRCLVFGGGARQKIGGFNAVKFMGDVIINNPSGIVMECPVQVDQMLRLQKGTLETGSDTLVLGSGASILEEDSNIVRGILSTTRRTLRNADESFGAIGVEIHFGDAAPDSVNVTRVSGVSPRVPGTLPIKRYYDLSYPGDEVVAAIALHYDPAEHNGVSESALILYSSSDGQSWIKQDGSIDTGRHTLVAGSARLLRRWTAAEVLPIPTIVSVSPTYGLAGTTIELNLTGTGFFGEELSISVSGEGIAMKNITAKSPTGICVKVALSPGSQPGSRDISVITGGGTSILARAFEVLTSVNPSPVVWSVIPSVGTRSQSVRVALRGAGTAAGLTNVSFGEGIAVCSVEGEAETYSVKIRIEPGAHVGPRNVTVSNPEPGGGSFVVPGGFTVVNPMPTLTSVTPSSVVRGTSMLMLIAGSEFLSGASSLSIRGEIRIDSFAVINPVQAVARLFIPPEAANGRLDICVTNEGPGGGTATLVGGLEVVAPEPRVVEVAPSSGVRGERLTLRVRGRNFVANGSVVDLGPGIIIDSLLIPDSETIVAHCSILRAATPGIRTVTVKNPAPGGGSSSLPNALVVCNPLPFVTGFSPAFAVIGTSSVVELTGSGFLEGVTTVRCGAGIQVSDFRSDSTGNHLRIAVTVAMDASPGLRCLSLFNSMPGGGTAEPDMQLSLLNPAPSVKKIAPAAGGRGEVLRVALKGENFIPGVSAASFGPGIRVDSVLIEAPGSMTAVIEIAREAVPGARGITIINAPPGGGTAALPHVFNVENPRPVISQVRPPQAVRGERVRMSIEGTGFLPGVTTLDCGMGIKVDSTEVVDAFHLGAALLVSEFANPGVRSVSVSNAPPGGGTGFLSDALTIVSDGVTANSALDGGIPDRFVLGEAFPNPFNPSTRIAFGLPERSRVRIDVVNILGNVTAELLNGEEPAGFHAVHWVAACQPSGVYVIRFSAQSSVRRGAFSAARKIVLVK